VASAAIGHAFSGDLQFDLAAAVLIGSIPGVLIGSIPCVLIGVPGGPDEQ
jgi:uncharacterized membrane protein YfcA